MTYSHFGKIIAYHAQLPHGHHIEFDLEILVCCLLYSLEIGGFHKLVSTHSILNTSCPNPPFSCLPPLQLLCKPQIYHPLHHPLHLPNCFKNFHRQTLRLKYISFKISSNTCFVMKRNILQCDLNDRKRTWRDS